jgi:hypothetical protein
MTPPKFNQKFNQNCNKNSTSETSGAENFSCFTTIWEEGNTELADYYSDEEEDNSLDNEDTRCGKNTGNNFNLEELGEVSDEEETWSEAEQDKFEFKNQNEVDYEEPGDRTTFTGISSLSVETAQAFSAWRPYIPRKHACRSLSAQSWWSDSSQQVSLLQEPTLTQISSIRSPDSTIGPTTAPMKMIPSQRKMRRSPLQDWKQSRPAMKPCMRIWSKPWPESSKMYKGTRSSLNESQDHPGQSKPFRRWKQPSQCSIERTKSPNTKLQSMPQETDAGNAHPAFTRCPSRTYLNMTSKPIITRTESVATKWRKFSSKIHNWPMKFPRHTKHCQKNSRRTLSWPWSPKQWPPICLSNTTTEVKQTTKWKISPHGENPFSKERSDDSDNNHKNENESQTRDNENSKSESESESKGIQPESENKIIIFMTDSETTVTAKADEVKAIRRTKNGIRKRLGKWLGKMTWPDLQVSSPLHFATTFTNSIVIFIYLIFTISILIFNYLLLDHLDHHFRTFTFGYFRVCEKHRTSRQTASLWAKSELTQLTTPDSTKSFRYPGP